MTSSDPILDITEDDVMRALDEIYERVARDGAFPVYMSVGCARPFGARRGYCCGVHTQYTCEPSDITDVAHASMMRETVRAAEATMSEIRGRVGEGQWRGIVDRIWSPPPRRTLAW